MKSKIVCKCKTNKLGLVDVFLGSDFVSLKYECFECGRSIYASFDLNSISTHNDGEYEGTRYYDAILKKFKEEN